MYRLFSPQEIINNIVTLSMPFIKDQTEIDFYELKQAYLRYLNSFQTQAKPQNEQLFYADENSEKIFADYFSDEEIDINEINQHIDINNVLYSDPLHRKNALEAAFTEIKNRDPVFANVFQLVMHTVFCTVSSRIGDTSANPKFVGVMCAYHDMTAEPAAIPELLIHEFTHNTLFLDERCHGHYKNYQDLKNPRTHLDATDRGIAFRLPFNRCLHSLVVSAEILLARDAYIGHTLRINQHLTSPEIFKRSVNYIKNINEQRNLFDQLMTERGREIFVACENFYLNYKLSS